jgi:predicted ABC-type ATPase
MTKRIAIFTQGLPGAGKSFVIAKEYGEADLVIDPDAVKESHPDYDPKCPEALHAWSKEITEGQYRAAIVHPVNVLVIDGTGNNSEKMVRKIREVQAAGYEAHLLYVKVSLETSLARNAAREGNVPEHVVLEKAEDIETAHESVAAYADVTKIINND